ncbi:ATP-binding protein [Roseateles sp.]|uniref:ATP-binding protein n=1 Tax=Roseateles sp. TaxID=1971397 RepID=UPI002F3E4C79
MWTGADPSPRATTNARALEAELQWLDRVLQQRLAGHFGQDGALASPRAAGDRAELPLPPSLPALSTPSAEPDDDLTRLIREGGLGPAERLVLALALAPHLRPQLMDLLFVSNRNLDRGFCEFGGWKGRHHGGFLPTVETAAFLLAGEDLSRRFALRQMLDETAPLRRLGMVRLAHEAPGEPWYGSALLAGADTLDLLCTGESRKPDYSTQFPAKLIETKLGWDDLVLDPDVMEEVEAIITWARHGDTLMRDWQLDKALKPGYRCLFFGPPGTGKTLTATLIGDKVGADVYRIDLSMVVSKYIGETEKNLAQVFDQAQHRRWILFFDEADALFGKRTATSSSNDRHANQEVSYLLQRVEDFPGTVILASNLKGNIDDAFARRFQSAVYFPMPDAEQRLRLWEGMVRHTGRLDVDVDLADFAERHELAGGAIANVVRFGAINAMQAGRDRILAADLRRGIAKELRKEGRTV